jgi:hypothetical protein
MTYLGFVRMFSSPLLAFVISAIIVSACGYAIYRFAPNKRAPAAARYWKLLSFAGEIGVAVGLIGLATFAGRMKVSADHHLLEERVHLSQAAVDERFRLAALDNCAPAERRPLAPYNPSVAKKDLCSIVRPFVGTNAPDADWRTAQQVLRDFGSKYPGCIENVFTRHSDCGDTLALATQLADEVRILQMNKEASRNDEAMSAMLEASDSWGFLLLAFLIAAIGVSIKCARAASDVFDNDQRKENR